MQKYILIIIVAIGLSSCASWKQYGYSGQGEQVTELQPITVPQDLSSTKMQSYYPVPAKKKKPKPRTYSNPAPREYYPIPDVVNQRQNNSETLAEAPEDQKDMAEHDTEQAPKPS